MKTKGEFKKVNIKNHMCYYFDDIINDVDIHFSDILLDQKLYQNISVYDISYKTSTCSEPLRIRFDKIDGFIRVHDDKFRHIVLFNYELFDKICNKIKYLISEESGIRDSINHDFGEIRFNSYTFLPTRVTLTFHNVIILIKSLVNKNKDEYFYNIF